MLASFHVSAQLTLNRISHVPRPGDDLAKQQVVFQSPGSNGTGVIWDFSELENIKDHYALHYITPSEYSDTIIGVERRTMFFYRLSGDSLFALGYENPTTSIRYVNPETILQFPFPYGRSVTGYFSGIGNYCGKQDVRLSGRTAVTADATGAIVLPGGDTLRNVLRVHTFQKIVNDLSPVSWRLAARADSLPSPLQLDSIDWRIANDTSHVEIDTWRWYALGYRLPIFESIRNSVWKLAKTYEASSVSYYYPPHEQYYGLGNDSENQEGREEAERHNVNPLGQSDSGSGDEFQDEIIHYRYSVNGNELILDYSLNDEADVAIKNYDFQGRQLSAIEKKHRVGGSFREQLSLGHSVGRDYLLHIQINDKVYGEKILK